MAAPLANLFNYAYMNAPPTSEDPAIQGLIDAGILTRQELSPARTISGENGIENVAAQNFYNLDTKRVPTTKYGDVSLVRPSDFGDFKLKNPNLKYDDPNYGSITPTTNTIDPSKQRDIYDLIGPIYAALITAGAGAPWFMTAGLGAAKAIGSGTYDALSLAGSAIPGLSDLGVPNELVQALQAAKTGYGAYNAAQSLGQQGQAQPQVPTQSVPGPASIPDVPAIPDGFYPELFGDLGSMVAPSDGSAMVASSVAPNAYNNSYGANGSSQLIT